MMDENTMNRRRIDYARCCVMIKAEQELPLEKIVDIGRTHIFKVEYEWIPVRCVKCTVFGNSNCASNTQRSNSIEKESRNAQASSSGKNNESEEGGEVNPL